MLHAVGVGYMELFATHIEAYKEAHIQGKSCQPSRSVTCNNKRKHARTHA